MSVEQILPGVSKFVPNVISLGIIGDVDCEDVVVGETCASFCLRAMLAGEFLFKSKVVGFAFFLHFLFS